MELQGLARLPQEELTSAIQDRLSRREVIMGFGHRFHSQDPRAQTLLALADELAFSGPHLSAARHIEQILRSEKGLSMNIEAAGGSILLDLGFDPAIAHLIIVIGRSPMFAAVYLERLHQNRAPFQRIQVYDLVPTDDAD
jgi:citrate synthase